MELSKAKDKESFSKLLTEMLEAYKKSIDISKFAGVLKDKDVSSWLNDVKEGRKRSFKRNLPRL